MQIQNFSIRSVWVPASIYKSWKSWETSKYKLPYCLWACLYNRKCKYYGKSSYWDTKSSSDSSNSILQMMSKIRLSDTSFFTLYFKLIMDENTNDTLSLFCFLFLRCVFNQKQIILYNSFTRSSPTMTIPASWFLIQILHIYKKLFFSFFSNNNVKDWFFYSVQLNLLKR